MRKNCRRALDRWNAGKPSPRSAAASIWSDGETLWSYGTALAVRHHDGAIGLNVTRYSRTTSAHQNALRAALQGENVRETDNVARGWGSERELRIQTALRRAA